MPGRSRSRSRSRGRDSRRSETRSSEARTSEAREERRRKRRTGWDVGGAGEPANPADPAAAAAIAAAAASRINSGLSLAPAMTPATVGLTNRPMTTPHPSMCRIYVGSLDYYLTELEIKAVFQAFGTVTSVDMPKEGDRSKGFCFVEYASPEAAQMALSTMNNFVLKGRSIKVGRPTAVGAGQPQQLLSRPMGGYEMGGAAANTSLVSSAQAGAAAATAILAGRAGQTPQGDMASLMAMGQQVSPEKQDAPQGSNRIYVGNVPFGFSSEDLKKIFVCFGPILTCQLLPSQENPQQHRGYGFIEFNSPDAAKLAIDTMNGFEVVGKQLKVNYATALRSAAVAGSLGVGMGMRPEFASLPQPEPATAAAAAAAAAAAVGGSIAEASLAPTPGMGANMVPLGGPPQPPAVAPAPPVSATPSPPPPAAPPAAAQPAAGPESPQQPFPEKPSGVPGSTNVLLLTNTVAPEEVDDDLKEEMREECQRFGVVTGVNVEIINSDVRIFIAFKEASSATTAAPQLHGRWFGGRQIHVHFYDADAFSSGNYSL